METPFTWSNRREGEGLIYEWLDRCVGNSEWCLFIPMVVVYHGSATYFAHLHLILCMEGDIDLNERRGPKPFKFESMWVAHEGCKKL